MLNVLNLITRGSVKTTNKISDKKSDHFIDIGADESIILKLGLRDAGCDRHGHWMKLAWDTVLYGTSVCTVMKLWIAQNG